MWGSSVPGGCWLFGPRKAGLWIHNVNKTISFLSIVTLARGWLILSKWPCLTHRSQELFCLTCPSTTESTLVQTEEAQQLHEGSPLHFVQIFMVPVGWTTLFLVSLWLPNCPSHGCGLSVLFDFLSLVSHGLAYLNHCPGIYLLLTACSHAYNGCFTVLHPFGVLVLHILRE